MFVGDKTRFAVEWNINETVGKWVLGSFIFWINGSAVGNVNDPSVDLLGVAHWVRAFLVEPRDRFEEGLFGLACEEVFVRLASSVLSHEDPNNLVEEFYDDTYARFHISHIGMSSFDAVTILLLKDKDGSERCVWKDNSKNIWNAYLPANEIERIFSEFILNFDASL